MNRRQQHATFTCGTGAFVIFLVQATLLRCLPSGPAPTTPTSSPWCCNPRRGCSTELSKFPVFSLDRSPVFCACVVRHPLTTHRTWPISAAVFPYNACTSTGAGVSPKIRFQTNRCRSTQRLGITPPASTTHFKCPHHNLATNRRGLSRLRSKCLALDCVPRIRGEHTPILRSF